MAFIPGRLSDHDLLDDKYVYRLRMMSGSLSAAMEQGSWCELEGAYFANWKASKMVIPYGEVGAQWWDAHFLSMDYGFGKSSASAHNNLAICTANVPTPPAAPLIKILWETRWMTYRMMLGMEFTR